MYKCGSLAGPAQPINCLDIWAISADPATVFCHLEVGSVPVPVPLGDLRLSLLLLRRSYFH